MMWKHYHKINTDELSLPYLRDWRLVASLPSVGVYSRSRLDVKQTTINFNKNARSYFCFYENNTIAIIHEVLNSTIKIDI